MCNTHKRNSSETFVFGTAVIPCWLLLSKSCRCWGSGHLRVLNCGVPIVCICLPLRGIQTKNPGVAGNIASVVKRRLKERKRELQNTSNYFMSAVSSLGCFTAAKQLKLFCVVASWCFLSVCWENEKVLVQKYLLLLRPKAIKQVFESQHKIHPLFVRVCCPRPKYVVMNLHNWWSSSAGC